MSKWLRAMNPFMKPRGMAEAQWAAQSFVFVVVFSFLGGLPVSIWMALDPSWFEDLLRQQYEAQGLPPADIEMATALFGYIMPASMIFGVLVWAAVLSVLAWVQWRKMTRVIPGLWLGYTAYSLLMGLAFRISGYSPSGWQMPDYPMGVLVISWAGTALAVVVAISSLRGAMMLHRLRREP